MKPITKAVLTKDLQDAQRLLCRAFTIAANENDKELARKILTQKQALGDVIVEFLNGPPKPSTTIERSAE